LKWVRGKRGNTIFACGSLNRSARKNRLIFPCGLFRRTARENPFSRAGDSPVPFPLFFRAVPLTNRIEIKWGSVHENLSCSSAPSFSLVRIQRIDVLIKPFKQAYTTQERIFARSAKITSHVSPINYKPERYVILAD
jgi:hypothetical protein